jgi:hypothetical protein
MVETGALALAFPLEASLVPSVFAAVAIVAVIVVARKE